MSASENGSVPRDGASGASRDEAITPRDATPRDASPPLPHTLTAYSQASTTDPPPTASRPSTKRLGRYILLEELGRGGMGVVLAAFDPLLDRRVALKLIRLEAHGSRRDSLRSRLFREAQALARLNHPN